MALNSLQDQLQNLDLLFGCLPFSPATNIEQHHERFDDIPRYLFQVFTPKSQGTTDMVWTKSKDARHEARTSGVDIFARHTKKQTADMLNSHLQWQECSDDNLVSWTSSLLFVMVYIFHLHTNVRDQSSFNNIHLCIIDTSSFPNEVFLQDKDLIRAYRSASQGLQNFEELHSKQHRCLSGYYYFGEYLSQGTLKIEDKC